MEYGDEKRPHERWMKWFDLVGGWWMGRYRVGRGSRLLIVSSRVVEHGKREMVGTVRVRVGS